MVATEPEGSRSDEEERVFGVTVVREGEAIVRELARQLTLPLEGECLYCYVHRMLAEYGCDHRFRWATHYRDVRAPRAKALEARLGRMAGCDCELFVNGVTLVRRLQVVRDDVDDHDLDRRWPETLPECAGIRTGSTQRCRHWTRRR
jgi:hypothetical protein